MKKQEVKYKPENFTPLEIMIKNPKRRLPKGNLSLTGFTDEEIEWLNLTPRERILETTKLWKFYISLGGSLDPEPDPHSPFYFKETSR